MKKDNSNLTESERILQLKNELFNDSKEFRRIKMESDNETCILDEHDLFKHDNSFILNTNDSKTFIGDNSAKLQDFNQNLDFLDEAQAFNIDDDRNTSSPLSAAFFSSMSSTTAEEVKEALEEVLPNEDDVAGTALDLYFLSGLSSQMMSSDDPLLSSVPRDFGVSRPNETPTFDIDPFSPPESKRIKSEPSPIESSSSDNCVVSDKSHLLSVQTEQILTKDNIIDQRGSVFLSPNSISSSSGTSPKLLQNALLSTSNTKKYHRHLLDFEVSLIENYQIKLLNSYPHRLRKSTSNLNQR